MTLYTDISYGGASRTYCAFDRWPSGVARDFNLTDGWNDRASSSKTWENVL